MAKNSIRKCRYNQCLRNDKIIDLLTDNYICINRKYFHKDCYEKYKKENDREIQQKKDIEYIKTLWINNISKTVVYGQLFKVLNNLIEKGIDSDYLVFAMEYCISHKLNLRYPAGFSYFVDREEIKQAYKESKIAKIKFDENEFKKRINKKQDEEPTFSVKKKNNGFQNIIR